MNELCVGCVEPIVSLKWVAPDFFIFYGISKILTISCSFINIPNIPIVERKVIQSIQNFPLMYEKSRMPIQKFIKSFYKPIQFSQMENFTLPNCCLARNLFRGSRDRLERRSRRGWGLAPRTPEKICSKFKKLVLEEMY